MSSWRIALSPRNANELESVVNSKEELGSPLTHRRQLGLLFDTYDLPLPRFLNISRPFFPIKQFQILVRLDQLVSVVSESVSPFQ